MAQRNLLEYSALPAIDAAASGDAPAWLTSSPSQPSTTLTATAAALQALLETAQQDQLLRCYMAAESDNQQKLLQILDDRQQTLLSKIYMSMLDAEIVRLFREANPAADAVNELAKDLKANKLSKLDYFLVLHKTLDVVKPQPNSEEFQTAGQAFLDTKAKLQASQKSNMRWGIFDAVIAGLCLAGAITIIALTFGKVLTHMTPALAIGLGVFESFESISHGVKAHGFFKNAKAQKSILEKMAVVEDKMIPQFERR